MKLFSTIVLSTVLSGSLLTTARADDPSDSWKAKTISPVANPLFFESPFIESELRPIFVWHNIDKSFVTGGGDVQVYAAQLRWAVTDRLAIIATKDGYIDFNPKTTLPHKSGFADLAAGVKYALIDNEAHEFILTPGLKIEVPTGNQRVFQGNGAGEWDLFVSAGKGFNNFHMTGSLGSRLPNDWTEETASLHYSLQADYYVCDYFIPFVVGNAFTVLNNGRQLPLDVEGYDLINFGSSNAAGFTQATVGAGFRSKLCKRLDFGFAYEIGVTNPKGLFDDRFTVDLVVKF